VHLIIIIALGIFGGLWLFTRWTEWQHAKRLRVLNSHLHPDLRLYRHTTPAEPK
jgi:hypothetical protein